MIDGDYVPGTSAAYRWDKHKTIHTWRFHGNICWAIFNHICATLKKDGVFFRGRIIQWVS